MRALLSILILIFASAIAGFSKLDAQTNTENEKQISGGFGHFFIGPALFQTQTMTDYLKRNDILGAAYSPSNIGYTIGGEGAAVFGQFIIGGGGFALISPITSTDAGMARATIGGGYFKMGYLFYKKQNTFMFAYAAVGGSGYNIELSNLSDSVSLHFNHKAPITPAAKENYSVSGFLMDLGVSLKTIPLGGIADNKRGNKKEKGGLILGFDAGCFLVLPTSKWSTEKIVVSGPPNLPQLLSPYIRLTIGGGGFNYNQK